ncbi:MAG: SHOCT domain-containing protein [Pseudomonadota bacterium]|nr:SHOCT domain-containing protein [Pseudomonadota bacterium]
MNDDVLQRLERLGSLLERGLLTPEEFAQQKAALLAADPAVPSALPNAAQLASVPAPMRPPVSTPASQPGGAPPAGEPLPPARGAGLLVIALGGGVLVLALGIGALSLASLFLGYAVTDSDPAPVATPALVPAAPAPVATPAPVPAAPAPVPAAPVPRPAPSAPSLPDGTYCYTGRGDLQEYVARITVSDGQAVGWVGMESSDSLSDVRGPVTAAGIADGESGNLIVATPARLELVTGTMLKAACNEG